MKWIGVCVVPLLLVVFGPNGSAQNGTGGIRGAVTSPDGPVSVAPIRAKHQSTGRVFSTTSANWGRFALTDLPAGIYEVSVPQIGLATAPFVQQNVNVELGKTTSLNIALVKGNQGVLGDDNAYLNDVWKNRLSTSFRDHPMALCLPGDPTPTPPVFYKFVQTRGILVFLFEHEPHYRQIFFDGRVHPQQADPTWMGHSVGKWDGDTLVVDTTGFNDKSWLIFTAGLPHTEMLHMVERYRRPDLGHLLVDLRLEDPGAFTKPVERHMTWELAPGEETLESICTENNKFPEYAGVK
jgi:hypothetical protein